MVLTIFTWNHVLRLCQRSIDGTICFDRTLLTSGECLCIILTFLFNGGLCSNVEYSLRSEIVVVWFEAFRATKYDELSSGLITLTTWTKMDLETLVFSPFNNLTSVIVWEEVIKLYWCLFIIWSEYKMFIVCRTYYAYEAWYLQKLMNALPDTLWVYFIFF